jgi:hypothetical protein
VRRRGLSFLDSVKSRSAMEIGGPSWPKRCACGAAWSPEAWEKLPFVARTPDHEGGTLELRTCTCRSTLAVDVAALEPDVISP